MTTKYKKIIDGKTVIKARNEIMLKSRTEVDGKVRTRLVVCPSEELLLADGWEVYTQSEPTAEELLQRAKTRKKNEIKAFDKSSEVNEFFVSGVSLWLSKEDRTGLKLRFESELALGKTTTTLWSNGTQFPLPLVDENGNPGIAFQMLYALELYASACYDNTQSHLAAIDKLEVIEEIEQYDYKVGYPEKLNL